MTYTQSSFIPFWPQSSQMFFNQHANVAYFLTKSLVPYLILALK